MNWKAERKYLFLIVAVFVGCFYLPAGYARFDNAVLEAFHLVKWYAQEHVLLCLVPAFFIAGAIGVFVSQAAVMKYLGAGANKLLAYGVASVSGTILAVCSCTILPLFAGIYRMGAGLGPATAFLYSGPAINVLAIVLTAAVLGPQLGIARGLGAVIFSVVIGASMAFIFRKEEREDPAAAIVMPEDETTRPLWQNGLYFFSMVGILVFANWGIPQDPSGLWAAIYRVKWLLTSGFAVLFAIILVLWFNFRAWKVGTAALLVAVAAIGVPAHPAFAFTVGFIGLSVITSLDKGPNGEWFKTSWDFATSNSSSMKKPSKPLPGAWTSTRDRPLIMPTSDPIIVRWEKRTRPSISMKSPFPLIPPSTLRGRAWPSSRLRSQRPEVRPRSAAEQRDSESP